MKISIANISLCVILALAVVAGGCRKKADKETKPAEETKSTKQSISELGGKAKEAGAKAGETAVDLKEEATEKVFSVVRQFEADQGKSVAYITAQAKEMAVENLRRMAEKYRDVIVEKQQQLKGMTQKYVDLADAERMTAEGQRLKAGVDEIKKGVDILKGRFGVYYNSLKEKAGNLTGLDI